MWSHLSDDLAFVPMGITQRRNLNSETHPAQMLSGTAFNWHAFRDGIRRGVCKPVSYLMSQKVYQEIMKYN